jgi:hypothetical protein
MLYFVAEDFLFIYFFSIVQLIQKYKTKLDMEFHKTSQNSTK